MSKDATIGVNEIREVRPISNNIDVVTIEAYVKEAQEQDLKSLLGNEFYNSFVDDINTGSPSPENQLLFDGGEYTNNANNSISFRGVKEYLSYCAYARLVIRQNSQLTRFGTVTKERDVSVPVSSADKNQERNDAGAVANSISFEITEFLDDQKSNYPLWVKKDTRTTNKSIKFFQPRRVQIP